MSFVRKMKLIGALSVIALGFPQSALSLQVAASMQMPLSPGICVLDELWISDLVSRFRHTLVVEGWAKPFRLLVGCKKAGWLVEIGLTSKVTPVIARDGRVGNDGIGWYALEGRVARTTVAPDGELISMVTQPDEWIRVGGAESDIDWRRFAMATAVHELTHQRQMPVLLAALGRMDPQRGELPSQLNERSIFEELLRNEAARTLFNHQLELLRRAILARGPHEHARLVHEACQSHHRRLQSTRSTNANVQELGELFGAMEGWASFEQVQMLRDEMGLSHAVLEVAGSEEAQNYGLLAAVALVRRDPTIVTRVKQADFMLLAWQELCEVQTAHEG